MSFEETELRLGLPGSEGEMTRKRGFHETMTTMADLKLNIISSSKLQQQPSSHHAKPPPPKAEVVGWPPIRSYRKKSLGIQKGSKLEDDDEEIKKVVFVKVSLDGAPYLRKLDLNIYDTYKQLSHALAKLFAAFTIIGNCASQPPNLIDLLNTSDYVPTYQDKDGDWMLVGDVPWQMFVESCKRLRIMKGKEANGLAPRTVEKCKKYKS